MNGSVYTMDILSGFLIITDRLYRSMRLLGIRPVTAPDEFTEIVEVVVEESEIEEGYVKIIVTRGSDDHNFTIPARSALQPNVLVYGKPIDLNAIEKSPVRSELYYT